MSRHNYVNPAFCQQSEFYPVGKPIVTSSPVKLQQSDQINVFQQRSNEKQLQHFRRYEQLPPRTGPKPQINLSTIYSSGGRNEQPERRYMVLSDLETNDEECSPKKAMKLSRAASVRSIKSRNDSYSILSIPSAIGLQREHSFSSPPRSSSAMQKEPKTPEKLGGFDANNSMIINNQRYALVPTDADEELVDANHEIIQMHNGKAHRYAVIPTDDDASVWESELDLRPKTNDSYATVNDAKQLYYTIAPQQLQNIPQVHQQQRQQTSAAAPPPPPMQKQMPTPTKSALATQKLHELLSTPKKPQLQLVAAGEHQRSIRNSPNRYHSQIIFSTSTPQKTNFTPQKLHYQQHVINVDNNHSKNYALDQFEQRSTAIISPRLASLSNYSEPSSNRSGANKSFSNLSFQKVANATATIGIISLMLILCGAMNSGLCLYMTTKHGRLYYLDVGIISGFAAATLGLLGCRSRQCDWLPNRNYISGYILLTVFSLLNCLGLLVLLVLHPSPGTALHDVTTGVILGFSSLTILIISLGVITSRWCRAPPPDNRVDVY